MVSPFPGSAPMALRKGKPRRGGLIKKVSGEKVSGVRCPGVQKLHFCRSPFRTFNESSFTIHNSPFTIHNSSFTKGGLCIRIIFQCALSGLGLYFIQFSQGFALGYTNAPFQGFPKFAPEGHDVCRKYQFRICSHAAPDGAFLFRELLRLQTYRPSGT